MRSPLSGYYGGKARLAPLCAHKINSVRYRLYVEPFCGGASVYFALPPRHNGNYVLNDTNQNLLNFYTQSKTSSEALIKLAEDRGVYSEVLHRKAWDVYCTGGDDVERAWAVWYLIQTSFGGMLNSGFKRTSPLRGTGGGVRQSVVAPFLTRLAKLREHSRLVSYAELNCEDYSDCVDRYDNDGTMFFLDPPYVGSNQGHYSGWRESDMQALLERLLKTKGRFVLTHYEHPLLSEFVERGKWRVAKQDMATRAGARNYSHTRTEWIVSNFGEFVLR